MKNPVEILQSDKVRRPLELLIQVPKEDNLCQNPGCDFSQKKDAPEVSPAIFEQKRFQNHVSGINASGNVFKRCCSNFGLVPDHFQGGSPPPSTPGTPPLGMKFHTPVGDIPALDPPWEVPNSCFQHPVPGKLLEATFAHFGNVLSDFPGISKLQQDAGTNILQKEILGSSKRAVSVPEPIAGIEFPKNLPTQEENEICQTSETFSQKFGPSAMDKFPERARGQGLGSAPKRAILSQGSPSRARPRHGSRGGVDFQPPREYKFGSGNVLSDPGDGNMPTMLPQQDGDRGRIVFNLPGNQVLDEQTPENKNEVLEHTQTTFEVPKTPQEIQRVNLTTSELKKELSVRFGAEGSSLGGVPQKKICTRKKGCGIS